MGRPTLNTLVAGQPAERSPELVPSYVQYNAFRWLRDTDFDPMQYALSEVSESTPEPVRRGLQAYYRFERRLPREEGLGLLDLGQEPIEEWYPEAIPAIMFPAYRYGMPALICGLFLAGVVLVGLPVLHTRARERKAFEPAPATDAASE
jgi:hypothetical protein